MKNGNVLPRVSREWQNGNIEDFTHHHRRRRRRMSLSLRFCDLCILLLCFMPVLVRHF